MVVPLWTTATSAATSAVTHQMGLEQSCLFLMREVGSYCDSVPVYATRMAGGENCRGFCYDLTPGDDGASAHGKWRLIRGRGSPPGSVVMFDPRIPGEGQCRLLLPDG